VLYKIKPHASLGGFEARGRLSNETTILKCGHFLERHDLGNVLFKDVNKGLEKNN
jgi:hypothetical protein